MQILHFIKRNEKGEDGLKPHETRLLNWFFNVIGDKNQVTTKQIENYGNISLTHAKAFQNESTLFTKSVNDLALQQNFFENSKSKGRKNSTTFITHSTSLSISFHYFRDKL